MKRVISLLLVIGLIACGRDNSYSVSKVLSGNSIELVNGSVVVLHNIQDNEANIKILKRYTTGSVQLYDANDEELTSLPADPVRAIVYNTDGDCLNELLAAFTEITKDTIPTTTPAETPERKKTVISFTRENGVMKVRAIINGIDMDLIFDTGASLISISQKEADNLRTQGKLSDDDILGMGRFSDANGDITEGSIINLATVEIGDRIVTNVKACVTQGQNVPLLLGQSVLEKFGRYSIDPAAQQIILEY